MQRCLFFFQEKRFKKCYTNCLTKSTIPKDFDARDLFFLLRAQITILLIYHCFFLPIQTVKHDKNRIAYFVIWLSEVFQQNNGFGPTTREFWRRRFAFLWLSIQFTLIRRENGAFWKRSLNRRNLKSAGCAFWYLDRKHCENELKLFEKWRHYNHMACLRMPEFFCMQIQNDRYLMHF